MSSSVVIAAWPIRLPKSGLGVFFQDPHRDIPGRQSDTVTSVWEKTKNIVRTQIPPPTRFSSTLAGLEQAWEQGRGSMVGSRDGDYAHVHVVFSLSSKCRVPYTIYPYM